jgi:hypothetical protein
LDMSDPDFPSQYDFNTAKIRIFILSSESFELLKETLYPGYYESLIMSFTDAFTSPEGQTNPSKDGSLEMRLNLSEKKIIVTKEMQTHAEIILEREGYSDRDLTEQERNIIKRYLKKTLIHEIIHVLGIATERPRLLVEGITEWYAQRIANRDLKDYFEPNDSENISYELETGGISILMIALVENNFSLEQIDKAFVGKDEHELERIIQFFNKRYGEDAVRIILDWNFHDSEESFDFIKELETKTGSNFGNLMKMTRKGPGRI